MHFSGFIVFYEVCVQGCERFKKKKKKGFVEGAKPCEDAGGFGKAYKPLDPHVQVLFLSSDGLIR